MAARKEKTGPSRLALAAVILAMLAAAFLLVIYGGYFVITYFTSRNMVKGVLRQP